MEDIDEFKPVPYTVEINGVVINYFLASDQNDWASFCSLRLADVVPVYGPPKRYNLPRYCNHCFSTFKKYGNLIDKTGNSVFCDAKECLNLVAALEEYHQIHQPTGAFVITNCPPKHVGDFDHYYFTVPVNNENKITEDFSLVVDHYINKKIGKLRFSKIFDQSFINDSVPIFENAMTNEGLHRKDFWESLILWISNVRQLVISNFWNLPYEKLSEKNKIILQIECLALGKCQVSLDARGNKVIFHKEMQQVENLLNFHDLIKLLEQEEKHESAVRLMNTLSNPETYMIRDIQDKVKKFNVGKKAIILSWSHRERVDLDLYVDVYENAVFKSGIFYRNKKTEYGELDFDANYNNYEENASECVTIKNSSPNIYYHVKVHNYNNCGGVVPFTIKIKDEEEYSTVFSGTWLHSDYINHTIFTKSLEPYFIFCGRFNFSGEYNLDVTDKETKRLNAQKTLFTDTFGEIRSVIDDIPIFATFLKNNFQIKSIDDLLSNVRLGSTNNNVPKSVLTLTEFLNLVKKDYQPFKILPREYNPGYVTHITSTKKKDIHIKQIMIFTEDGLPVIPSENNTAVLNSKRFDSTWFNDGDLLRLRDVVAFCTVNNFPFFILEGIQTPKKENGWELLSGCYSSQLSPQYHELRTIWGLQNTIVKVPFKEDGMMGFIPPMKQPFKVYVNNKLITVVPDNK